MLLLIGDFPWHCPCVHIQSTRYLSEVDLLNALFTWNLMSLVHKGLLQCDSSSHAVEKSRPPFTCQLDRNVHPKLISLPLWGLLVGFICIFSWYVACHPDPFSCNRMRALNVVLKPVQILLYCFTTWVVQHDDVETCYL